jgi:hypothetical protein
MDILSDWIFIKKISRGGTSSKIFYVNLTGQGYFGEMEHQDTERHSPTDPPSPKAIAGQVGESSCF